MADLKPTFKERIITAAPYVLPVLGGGVGMAVVNLNRSLFLNPVWAIVTGVVVGWLLARGLVYLLTWRR
ncbi:MAG: hypothetical protein OQK05_05665 [Pseudopelagicola sp.]|nr:hypothetical protein [Pseudopelagicola sp.]